jgi:hypothetical protein
MSAPLRRKAASAYLLEKFGIERAPGTLAKLATLGGGPVFHRVGRIPVYATDDLDAWAMSLISEPMRSTSEHRTAKAPGVVKPEESAGFIDTGLSKFAAKLPAAKRHGSS